VIKKATAELNAGGVVQMRTWEDMAIGGKLVIAEICREIDDAHIFCADVTTLNQNVMFELGYAIAVNKRIWLTYDPTLPDSATNFAKLQMLTTVGYAKYTNSHNIVHAFLSDKPFDDLAATVFEQAIKPNLPDGVKEILLYLKSRHNTEASVVLSQKTDKAAAAAGVPLIVDDPRESSVQPLSWYGEQVYSAVGVICHLISPEREGALLHNARYSLVAGLAHGMKRPLLILKHGSLAAPIDYRDLAKSYQTASEAEKHFDNWIVGIISSLRQRSLTDTAFIASVELARELSRLRIGEPLAENEADRLKNEYFVETAAYREAFEGRQTIFVGRKGAGKSANFIKLTASLEADKRNLVCVVKPVAYELHGIVELLARYREADIKGFAIESLWKFLIYSEMALAAEAAIQSRLSGQVETCELDLIALLNQNDGLLRKDFSIRLESCIESLLANSSDVNAGTEMRRGAISEALHSGFLKHLRDALSSALSRKQRVAILVDNLDKAWDKQSDVEHLSGFLLGLLKAATRISNDFRNVSATQKGVNVSLAVFIRADIFQKVLSIAPEPDKIPFSKISWTDDELLLRFVEERFVSSMHEPGVSPNKIWNKYFDREVKGIEVRKYLLSRTLRRPRDLLVFVKAAITTAVNRKHAKISADDILSAERQYSQFAIDSILVENGISMAALEDVLYEFAGSKVIMSKNDILNLLGGVHVPANDREHMIEHLCALTFFGLEIRENEFRYAEDQQEAKKNAILARKYAEGLGATARYKINPAFCSFLEIVESEPALN